MKKIVTIFLIVVLAGFTVATGICNWISNEEFFTATITQVLTLAITLSVAFWATQYKTDLRKSKEHAEGVIEKLQILVSDVQFYSIPSEGNKETIQKQLNTNNRKINNCISILEEYAKILNFKNEMKYIRNEFETYKTRMGDHFQDLDYLSKSEIEFKRIAENIDTKCDYIILHLYK